jgi:uncharacterized protein YajQ (UPF0234 family)
MAKECSFDIVSEVNMQEVDNAINQTLKEIGQRFDFRGSASEVTLEEGKEIKIISDDDYKLKSVIDILQTKLMKRNVSLKNLEYGKVESASHGTVRQIVKVKNGIDKEQAKAVVAAIKNMKLKAQAQIMDDQVRVSAKDKDDLQNVIAKLKQEDFGIDLQFVNYRS